MKLRNAIRWFVAGLCLASTGLLAGSSSITVLDSAGLTKTYSVVTEGGGNFVGRYVICDQAAAANCATVSGNALSDNVAQINGVTPLMGNGASGTGALRVTIANDSTGQVALAAGAATIGALTANQSVNVAQLAGTATSVNNGAVDAGTLRVTLANNSTGVVSLATGANTIGALTANQSVNLAQVAGVAPVLKAASTNVALTDTSIVVAASPNPTTVCDTTIAVNQTTSTDLKTFTNTGYLCSIVLISATAQNLSLVYGTGTVCATGIAAIIGGTTASVAVAVNGGFSAASDRPLIKMAASAQHLCLLQSGAGNVSGFITYQDHA